MSENKHGFTPEQLYKLKKMRAEVAAGTRSETPDPEVDLQVQQVLEDIKHASNKSVNDNAPISLQGSYSYYVNSIPTEDMDKKLQAFEFLLKRSESEPLKVRAGVLSKLGYNPSVPLHQQENLHVLYNDGKNQYLCLKLKNPPGSNPQAKTFLVWSSYGGRQGRELVTEEIYVAPTLESLRQRFRQPKIRPPSLVDSLIRKVLSLPVKPTNVTTIERPHSSGNRY